MTQSVPPRRGLISLIRRLFGALFGRLSWEPAPWQARFGGHLRRRRRWWLGGLSLALMLGSGWYWWINRPVVIDPEALSVRVLAPDPTNYRDLPLQFDSLELRFSGRSVLGNGSFSTRGNSTSKRVPVSTSLVTLMWPRC